MIRVAVVDDQEMIRLGLRGILEKQQGIEVVADASDGLMAVDLVTRVEIDVLLMDVRMPGIDGVEATRRIRALVPADELRIVVLTTFDQDATVLAALRAGADGFLSKGVGPAELVAGIEDVASGGGVLSAAASAALIQHVAVQQPRVVDAAMVDRFAALTPRERAVVVAATTGADNAEIATQMFVSPFTVKTHVNRAMAKVGARDRGQLIAFAYRAGLAS